MISLSFFFFQAEDGIRDSSVTGVQTCALPISSRRRLWDRSTTPHRARGHREPLATGFALARKESTSHLGSHVGDRQAPQDLAGCNDERATDPTPRCSLSHHQSLASFSLRKPPS